MADGTAIFPLKTILFPGGVLPIRVFEARYIDMVRESLSRGQPFGVCMLRTGEETGREQAHESIGCFAKIADWDMPQPGILNIKTVGLERFQITQTWRQPDGLLRAKLTDIAPEAPTAVPDEFEKCAKLLQRIITELEEARKHEPPHSGKFLPFEPPFRLNDASWVSCRLAEIIPMASSTRYELLTQTDPIARLARVKAILVESKVI